MSIDSVRQPEPRTYQEGSTASTPIRVLTSVEQIELRLEFGQQAFNALKDRTFDYTWVYEQELLVRSSLIEVFEEAFLSVGWANFWEITEPVRNFSPLNS